MPGDATPGARAPGQSRAETIPGFTEALVQASPDAVIVVDAEGIIRMASPAVGTVFGYDPAELLGQPVEVLVPERFRTGHTGYRRDYVADPHARPMGAGLELEGRRKDGTSFPIDVSLAPVTVEGRRLVGAFVRDVTERRRAEAVVEYGSEINQALLSTGDSEEALTLISERARRLVDAAAAWVVVPAGSAGLVVAAAHGLGAEELRQVELPAGSLSERAISERKVVAIDDMSEHPDVVVQAQHLGLGPGMYVPVADEVVLGALVVARARDQSPFTSADFSVVEVFASAAGVALSLGRARRELEELRFVAEHDRIARDLHDTVIQRLFALGMGLQGAQRIAPPAVAERIDAAVGALDEVIREIRETIFDLQQPPAGRAMRDQVRVLLDEAREHLGFAPVVTFRGPVEAAMTDDVSAHALAVLREALSNAARHAGASKVQVTVEAEAGAITVRVSDDGRGPPTLPSSGYGLANMAARASELGGSFQVGPGPLGGTLLEWRVPAG
ncbi:MAG TPA: PAS domain S-box protein [Acidimicrobiales bacterium]|nr:PAS domain S-box protein [Acidimicrobiales bacterium]